MKEKILSKVLETIKNAEQLRFEHDRYYFENGLTLLFASHGTIEDVVVDKTFLGFKIGVKTEKMQKWHDRRTAFVNFKGAHLCNFELPDSKTIEDAIDSKRMEINQLMKDEALKEFLGGLE